MKFFAKPFALIVFVMAVSACGFGSSGNSKTDASPAKATADPVVLAANVQDAQADVPVDTKVAVTVQDGTISSATLTSAADGSTIGGTIQSDGSWLASSLLDPGTSYTLAASASNPDGAKASLSNSFSTKSLAKDEMTYASVTPGEGQTVGVGMPIIVTFDVAVTDKAAFERQMTVTTEPQVNGSWNWISSRTVHWRPENYWPANTKVQVKVETKSVNAGDGIYGQNNVESNFTIGAAMVSTVDVNAHTMTVTKDGAVLKVIPVTTGAPATASRNGTKIIMEKYTSVRMDGATVGYSPDSPDYYNIDDVQYAMRLTNSGEFVHAAPWSEWAQGNTNVSHACVGMSTANAKWLFDQSRVGDVVTFVNSPRVLEQNNGWTDWNVDWATWQQGSALYGQAAPTATPATPTTAS